MLLGNAVAPGSRWKREQMRLAKYRVSEAAVLQVQLPENEPLCRLQHVAELGGEGGGVLSNTQREQSGRTQGTPIPCHLPPLQSVPDPQPATRGRSSSPQDSSPHLDRTGSSNAMCSLVSTAHLESPITEEHDPIIIGYRTLFFGSALQDSCFFGAREKSDIASGIWRFPIATSRLSSPQNFKTRRSSHKPVAFAECRPATSLYHLGSYTESPSRGYAPQERKSVSISSACPSARSSRRWDHSPSEARKHQKHRSSGFESSKHQQKQLDASNGQDLLAVIDNLKLELQVKDSG
ncbi:unnamed protein product [Caenorhabditis auriculariae]|uniref:Uncharacterized protein n=1 Tax=Caenorhabditis auriculariae TaxID=2777116 RepID=A0A8S1I0G5_9PELO|nr:unnamed protein product [Caenorhabditis auriculariae]